MMFSTHTLDRERCDWSEHLEDLSPVQMHGGTWLKREDLFAPLGEGGINGSKLRGCIMMLRNRYEQGAEVIYTGASIKSPQHSMTAAVCHHFGMDSIHVIGATKADTAIKAIQVQMGAWFGARYQIIGAGFNPNLQHEVRRLVDATPVPCATMPYGISPEGPEEILEFHRLGGLQVQNLPDVHTLIIPAGSCNSLASILYGLQKNNRPTSLRRIVTVAIGPDKTKWVWERLKQLEVSDGYRYHQYATGTVGAQLAKEPQQRNYLEIVHLDLHGEGFAGYQDEMKESIGEVKLHPTYEGKVRRYLNKNYPFLQDDRTCMWIVGGPSSIQAMWDSCSGELGTPPSRLPIFDNPIATGEAL